MNRTFLRCIALTVIILFSWSFVGFVNIAQAIESGQLTSKSSRSQKSPGPEKRLETVLEGIRSTGRKAQTKIAKGADVAEEEREILYKKGQVDALDTETRKQFRNTEKQIETLPEEIKERHRNFVKHYDEKMNILKSHMAAIGHARTRTEKDSAYKKVHEFLEEVKPPKRHTPLDPNKLPHRIAKPVSKTPRTRPEEFLKDTQSAQRPVRLASTGALKGLVTQNTVVAQATGAPTSTDLAETAEVQFTAEIKAKAQELGNNPVKIYNWVRNNIEFVPTYGSIQGAHMTLLTKQGNAFDTASLLIALLRISGIHARYNYGTIELPIEKVMNWVGGFSDPMSALNFIASGGIPVQAVPSGGTISKVRMEHVWVEGFIDYFPSRGSRHKTGTGDTWIPLDPSYKQYAYTQGIDLKAQVAFDAQTFINRIQSTAIIDQANSSVTGINSAYVQTQMQDYQARIKSYINQNYPNATVGDVLGKKEIVQQEFPYLLGTLPYAPVVVGFRYSEMPDVLRHKVTVTLTGADGHDSIVFTHTVNLPQIAGKRFTLSYDPATSADQDTVNRYAEQYATAIPAYLVTFKPVLRTEGSVLASGAPISMGLMQNLIVNLSSPDGSENAFHKMVVGDYSVISINPSVISAETIQNGVDNTDHSDPVGEMLHLTGMSYWAEVDALNKIVANSLGVKSLRHPSELLTKSKVSVSYSFGVPISASYDSRNMDAQISTQSVMSPAGGKAECIQYAKMSGIFSSYMEAAIFDQLFPKKVNETVSAVVALNAANEQGIPSYEINTANASAILPVLQVPDAIKADVADAVNSGHLVYIPKGAVTYTGWTGEGYIIINPEDGSGAYRIMGGLDGADNQVGATAVYPLPQAPATPAVMLMLGSLTRTASATLVVEEGVVVGLAFPEVLAVVALVVACIIVAVAIAESISENRPPEDWVTLRHYSSIETIPLIKASREVRAGDPRGVFLTDLFLEPLLPRDPRIPPDLIIGGVTNAIIANSNYIHLALELPDTNPSNDYIALKINRAALSGFPTIYKACTLQYVMPCNEWLFPLPALVIDEVNVIQVSP